MKTSSLAPSRWREPIAPGTNVELAVAASELRFVSA